MNNLMKDQSEQLVKIEKYLRSANFKTSPDIATTVINLIKKQDSLLGEVVTCLNEVVTDMKKEERK